MHCRRYAVALTSQIRERLKATLSARHVPNEICQVPAVPRTLAGKKLELPIRKLLPGPPLDRIVTPDTIIKLECLA